MQSDSTHPDIGVDAEEQDLTAEEVAPVYPVSDKDRIGVSTFDGTDPAETDQADEQNDDVLWGTPDAPGKAYAYPPKEDDISEDMVVNDPELEK